VRNRSRFSKQKRCPVKKSIDFSFALVGNPNVGKSVIFNHLTGLGVQTANYQGTTVVINKGQTVFKDKKIEVVDLPGAYGLEGISEDQQVTRAAILEQEFDCLIAIADATNLQRNLYLVLQLIDLGLPVVLCLNLTDLAESKKISTDTQKLEQMLGVPVVSTVATQGRGLDLLIETAMKVAKQPHNNKSPHKEGVEETQKRHKLAKNIVRSTQKEEEIKETMADKLWRYSTHPVIGLAMLLSFVTAFFGIVVFSGLYISKAFEGLWKTLASPAITSVIHLIVGNNSLSKILLWGLDDGVLAGLSIGVAFILPFYFLLSLLEDSGYLNSIAFLTDRVAHRIGLHGRSIIPLISAAGCNVPAIMGTRALGNKRERFIASTLISMTPCSARTAVILGSVALFAGIDKAVLIYLITLVLIFGTGFSLNKIIPGKSTGLVMEIFPFRVPTVKNTVLKTWMHLKGFISQALPLIVIGSFLMGFLIELKLLPIVSKPLSFISVTVLGLPAITGLVLLAGFLRKEMALGLLYVLAAAQYGSGFKLPDLMSSQQMFIFALVVALYIPCLASFSVLGKELGWKKAVYIGLLTTVIALTIGGLFHLIFSIL